MAGSRAGKNRRARAVAAAAGGTVAALLALSACGSSGGHGPAARGPTHRSEVAVLHRLVDCIRAHGVPGFPDGSIDSHGVVSFPQSAPRVPDGTVTACRPIFDQLPPQPATSPPVPQALFAKLLTFARCMRSHGVTHWPDPAPSGTFFLDRELIAAGKRGIYRQLQTCEQLNPGVGGHFSVAQGG